MKLAVAVALTLVVPAAALDDDTPGHQVDLHVGPLFGGTNVSFDLRTTLPGAPVFVFFGTAFSPTVFANPALPVIGVSPPSSFVVLTTDANGFLQFEVPASPGMFTPGLPMYFQVGILTPAGIGVASKVKGNEMEPTPAAPGFLTDQASTFFPASYATAGANEIVAGDYDRDGYPDLVQSTDASLLLWTNDGTGTFTDDTAVKIAYPGDPISNIALGDLDADGALDLLVAGGPVGFPDRLYVNDGTGVFTQDLSFPAGDGQTFEFELGDIDEDGDLDIALAVKPDTGSNGVDQLYVNQGGGVFVADVAFATMAWNEGLTDSLGMEFGDVDRDGDLDLYVVKSDTTGVVGILGERNRLLLNDGTGVFTDFTITNLPFLEDNSQDAELVDIDGDGDLDILVANSLFGVDETLSGDVLINLGGIPGMTEGVFADNPASFLDIGIGLGEKIRLGVQAADIDGDGDKDVLLLVHDSVIPGFPMQQGLFLNDGGAQGGAEGAFVKQTWFDPANAIVSGAAFLDIDGDGDLEIVLTANGIVTGDPAQAFNTRLLFNSKL
ncbi:MAG: VCBS repeat-containing protein [Planctomycetota bacterium]|nr:VCBS repeat-containing protein [Planctomycetota bacterium]